MARDRQRSKARQQQRREERLAQRGDSAANQRPARSDAPLADFGGRSEAELEGLADLEVGAPPEDVGRSDRTLREEPPPPSFATDDDALAGDLDDGAEEPETRDPRGLRGGGETGETHRRGRLVAFLVAVWAELQRVQWPDRRQLTQLTGVVLFFVLVVGAYLGALDAIFSKLIQAIL